MYSKLHCTDRPNEYQIAFITVGAAYQGGDFFLLLH